MADGAPDDLERVLACPPWPARVPHVPSEARTCEECGCRVAVAKSSWRVLALGARILCNACVGKLIDGGEIDSVRRAWRPEEIE